MTCLVTGGAGYIGSHMVLALRDAGRPCGVLDDLSTGVREAVPADVPFAQADISDSAAIDALCAQQKISTLIHFAAKISVPESVAAPGLYYRVNVAKTLALFETCARQGIQRVIFSSTAAVYGHSPLDAVDEDAPLAPLSPYGASKMMAERLLQDLAAAHGLSFVILRYFNVAGADPRGRAGQRTKGATHLIKVAVEAALGKRAGVEMFGTDYPTPDGTCIRDYIHVSDLAQAHCLAVRYLEAGGASGIFNCGYGQGASVKDVVASVQRVAGVSFPVSTAPRRAGDPARIVAKAERVRRVLGFQPLYDSLDTIIAHSLAFERSL